MRCQAGTVEAPCFSTATHAATVRKGGFLEILKVCSDHALELRAAGVEAAPMPKGEPC